MSEHWQLMAMGAADGYGRRALLGGSAAVVAGLFVPGSLAAKPGSVRKVTLRSKGNPEHSAVALVPTAPTRGLRYPAGMFLHGFAEASDEQRSLDAWPKGYGLETARNDLVQPPITPSEGARSARTATRAKEISGELAKLAFREVVLICPRTPVPYQLSPKRLSGYADWLTGELVEQVAALVPLRKGGCGLSGFSMGGRVALEVLLRKPASFSTVSLVQAEFLKQQEAYYANRVVKTLSAEGKPRVQVLTASGDPYKTRSENFARILKRSGFPVDMQVRRGRHSAAWMKELGSLETLFWQERALHHSA